MPTVEVAEVNGCSWWQRTFSIGGRSTASSPVQTSLLGAAFDSKGGVRAFVFRSLKVLSGDTENDDGPDGLLSERPGPYLIPLLATLEKAAPNTTPTIMKSRTVGIAATDCDEDSAR